MSSLVTNYDSEKNLLFVQKHRCGTSLLYNIATSGLYPEFSRYSYGDLFKAHGAEKLSPENLTVKNIYRHPVRNFMSGLVMVIHNNELNFFFRDSVPSLHTRYHLGDNHLHHDLMQGFVLGAAGYNLEFIKISDYTEFLLTEFPKCEDIILEAHQDGSFEPNDAPAIFPARWLFYENHINSNNFYCSFYRDWDDWFEPELRLFDYIISYENIDPATEGYTRRELCIEALDYLLNHSHYWAELPHGNIVLRSQLELIVLLADNYPDSLPGNLVDIARKKLRLYRRQD